ncbi:hypothetical protein D8674_028356 [Pyrus ussuriensis x Pyrus communis]|uniref:Uncharacterized protein n=1 Tax=Pyrus ussuriensis x Pyrus communis TaxID=2448454 RepID=A0A5N5HWW4_9ROSA|nr:hypothetical protein D8674_028356 [Pyrus ussuriensis x Pyrus communis]
MFSFCLNLKRAKVHKSFASRHCRHSHEFLRDGLDHPVKFQSSLSNPCLPSMPRRKGAISVTTIKGFG